MKLEVLVAYEFVAAGTGLDNADNAEESNMFAVMNSADEII